MGENQYKFEWFFRIDDNKWKYYSKFVNDSLSTWNEIFDDAVRKTIFENFAIGIVCLNENRKAYASSIKAILENIISQNARKNNIKIQITNIENDEIYDVNEEVNSEGYFLVLSVYKEILGDGIQCNILNTIQKAIDDSVFRDKTYDYIREESKIQYLNAKIEELVDELKMKVCSTTKSCGLKIFIWIIVICTEEDIKTIMGNDFVLPEQVKVKGTPSNIPEYRSSDFGKVTGNSKENSCDDTVIAENQQALVIDNTNHSRDNDKDKYTVKEAGEKIW